MDIKTLLLLVIHDALSVSAGAYLASHNCPWWALLFFLLTLYPTIKAAKPSRFDEGYEAAKHEWYRRGVETRVQQEKDEKLASMPDEFVDGDPIV